MATQKDVQDLLRLLTTGRNKLPMMAAMGRVKALQAVDLRSISAIATSDLPTLTKAISDEKSAKSLLAACKAYIKSGDSTPGSKRAGDDSLLSSSKRQKSAYELSQEPQTPAQLEASLILPQPSADEEAIVRTIIYTNRAPLVLAFAVALLKWTMPEQPLSSRLSLAQAVVSLNSRSKAVSIGLEKGKAAEQEGWGMGQPKVSVLGRAVSVLKRTGYEWREPVEEKADGETKQNEEGSSVEKFDNLDGNADVHIPQVPSSNNRTGRWAVSGPVTSKKSTFIARSITVTSASEAISALEKLLSSNPDLKEADHTITAYRIQGTHGIIESSNDDGESGGGNHILRLLQSDNITNILLVVTRWYGGIMLGPDRWRIMTQVSRDVLSQRLRVSGTVGREALWGLDLEAMRSTDAPVVGVGMPIHRPENARAYILKAFGSPPSAEGKKKKSGKDLEREREKNLGLLLGALDLVFESWQGHVGRDELDRRAWSWYVKVRPEVEGGVAGWGGKGEVRLADILDLRRKG